jgi:hypothetical protein
MQMHQINTTTWTVNIPPFLDALTLEKINEDPTFYNNIMGHCGCFTTWLTQAMFDESVQQEGVQANAPSLCAPEGAYFIFMAEDYLRGHTFQEREAILRHELAHIELGHIAPLDQLIPEHSTEVMDLQHELDADTHAANQLSKGTMRDALNKLIHRACVVNAQISVLKGHAITFEELYVGVIAHPQYCARLKALQD